MYYPTLRHEQNVTQDHFLSKVISVLNSKNPFSYTACLTKEKELSLAHYYPFLGEEEMDSCLSQGYKCNAISYVQDLNSGCCLHFYDDNHYSKQAA